jgi:hypothetical protein
MADLNSSCPYCNATLPPLATTPTTEKLPCPRCGEMVPAARWRVDAATGIRPGEPPLPTSLPRGEGTKADNRKTAFIIVGIMALMALLGGAYALWTTKERQDRHPWMPQKLEPIAFRRPLELPGLAYLPKDCRIVAAVQVAEILQDEKAGKPLLAEPRPKLLDWPIKQITRTSGLTLEDIDHVVIGANDLTQAVMIVKARAKISQAKIVEARPVKTFKHEGRPAYEFTVQPPATMLVWSIDDETLAYVIRLDDAKAEHLRVLSAQPKAIREAVPGRDVFVERLPTQNFAWAAGQLDQVFGLPLMLALMTGGKAELGFVKDLKTFTVGITPEAGLTLVGNFHLTDAKAAASFKTQLEGVRMEGMTAKVVSPEPNAAEQWVSWQVRGDAARLRAWLDARNGGK